jgi:uncharacterized protein (DUF4415 family)
MASDLAKVDAHVIASGEYAEIPELTDEMLERADLYDGESLIRRGRPRVDHPKQQVTLRLDADLIAHFKSGGAGWQTRINATLRRAMNDRS